VLYLGFRSDAVAGLRRAAMALRSVSEVINALRLDRVRL
jgi:hypothetical protein